MSAANWPWPRLFAHRCGGTLAPENTLEALEIAARFGTGVEFDVMLSGEDTPHLMHDETLDRTTNGHGRVAEIDDVTLAGLDASMGFERFRGARIPRLIDAAHHCRALGLAVNLEIKPPHGRDTRNGARIAALARQCWHDCALPPLISSFSDAALSAARDTAPELPRGLLVGAIPEDWQERCMRIGAVSLHADARHITRREAAAVRSAGLWLVLYTENDPQRADQLFAWGANAIVTDRPDRVHTPSERS